MKKTHSSSTARATLSALFYMSSIVLIIFALTTTGSRSAPTWKGLKRAKQSVAAPTAPTVPAAPQDVSNYVGYENFAAPGVLVPVKTTEAGQQPNSVEYMGRNAGEPSVGSNWATGVANFQSGLQTLFITFNDSCPANGQAATWVNRAANSSVAVDSDPIAFTDRGFTDPLGTHSRVFVGQLTLLSPNTVKLSHSDDDGVTWIGPDQSGPGSAVDHESIGAGPYRNEPTEVPPVVGTPLTTYPNAVYYCSQDIATAFCARSDNGGLTYNMNVPLYSLLTCGGLHGHVKVTPSTPATIANHSAGVVYVPNPDCGAQAVVVSKDNGISWTVRQTPISNPGGSGVGSDPAVGIDDNGRVYFLGAANGSTAIVATSDDQGQTWQHIFDVSSVFGLHQIAFPAAVGGSGGRAAVAFYGSTGSTGDSNAASFNGVWHLYVAHTFDGGASWTTVDVTPNGPMQRSGLLRGGGANITRNLLDFFDMAIDNQGRVLIGYVDGCEGGNCKQAAANVGGNAYSVTATIARQSSGKRLLAAFDPASSTEAPGMPSVNQIRIGHTVRLSWSEADTGNSPITSYQILRSTSPNTETLLTTVTGTQTGGSYTDLTATDTTKSYYYKVVAVNAVGSSCPNNEIEAPYIGNACTGLIMHKNDPTHPEANAGANTPASLAIDYVAMGEPASRPNDFIFKMKVTDLGAASPANTPPPNSRWRIVLTSPAAESYPAIPNPDPTSDDLIPQQFYVGMTTGPSGAPTFEYGTLCDAGAPAVFLISETKVGDGLSGSNFNPDGTITIYVPKTALGFQHPAPTAPPIGTLFGGVNGRTITGDTSDCAAEIVPVCSPNSRLERSNAFVDHTFAKAQSDNGFPAATYTVIGGSNCEGGVVPLSAVSRKNHASGVGVRDLDLPLSGNLGVECRQPQGPNPNQHQIVVTFDAPVTLSAADIPPGKGSVLGATATANQIILDVTIPNTTKTTLTLHGVNDGTNVGDVAIPIGVLFADTDGSGRVDSNDVTQARQNTLASPTQSPPVFRNDVDLSGRIDSNDVTLARQNALMTLQ